MNRNDKKVLFIDRDGTLILEPKCDFQVDSFEKMEFYPEVFFWLGRIVRELEYELVMVTNQDGLGTASFPEDSFWPVQNKVIKSFKNEGIEFTDVYIDKSFENDNSPNRKPRIGLLPKYIYGPYDMPKSFVIGDRLSDMELASNLKARGIYLNKDGDSYSGFSTTKWECIYNYIKSLDRTSIVQRVTKETEIVVKLNLDGQGLSNINTGLGFFDHMLEQISRHSDINLEIHVNGDLDIDDHHTIEDVGLSLGTAFFKALGEKKSIERYGFLLPMDDCLAQVAVDFGGRPYFKWSCEFYREKVGDVATEMFSHFFKSFSDASYSNLNIAASGQNEHHKIESIFKAFAKAVKMAIQKTDSFRIPSTKGIL